MASYRPRKWKRQRRQRGQDKAKARQRYRKNRSKNRMRAKKRYKQVRNNSAYKRRRSLYRKNRPSRKRLASMTAGIEFVRCKAGGGLESGCIHEIDPWNMELRLSLECGRESVEDVEEFLSRASFYEESDIDRLFDMLDQGSEQEDLTYVLEDEDSFPMGKEARPHFRNDLTTVFSEDFPIVVREAVFQKVVAAFAHGLGGKTRDGKVEIPFEPYHFTVLYNKWYDPRGPRISFMIYPTRKGNRSKFYRAFEGPVEDSQRLMVQFAGWLNLIKVAIYKRNGIDTKGMETRLRGMKFASAMVKVIKQLEARPDALMKAASTDEKALKWLEARAKKGKGAFVPHVVQRAFEMLGKDWSIEEVVTVTPKVSTWNKAKFMGGYFKDRTTRVNEPYSKKDPWQFWTDDGAAEGDATITAIRSHTQEFSGKEPPSPRLGQLYITRPTLQKGALRDRLVWSADKLLCGTRGWKITTPKSTFTVALPVDAGGEPVEKGPAYKLPTVWTGLYKGGLQDAAKKALEGSSAVEKAKEKVEKSKPVQMHSPTVEKLLRSLTARKKTEAALFWEDQMQDDAELYKKALKEAQKAGKWPPAPYQLGVLKDSRVTSLLSEWEEVQVEEGLYTRVPTPDFSKKVMQFAETLASQAQEEFVLKNTKKLSAIVMAKGVKLKSSEITKVNQGPIDFGGELRFEFEDGSGFTVRNKTVWKQSSTSGKTFTQFPTTFHKVKLPDGTALKGPSEKKMVEEFAKR